LSDPSVGCCSRKFFLFFFLLFLAGFSSCSFSCWKFFLNVQDAPTRKSSGITPLKNGLPPHKIPHHLQNFAI